MRYVHGMIVRAGCALAICCLVALLASSRKDKVGETSAVPRGAIVKDLQETPAHEIESPTDGDQGMLQIP
jgi:hypothetical protein